MSKTTFIKISNLNALNIPRSSMSGFPSEHFNKWSFIIKRSHLDELFLDKFVLTVEEAVVFEAASTEQCVEGVQALFALYRASVWTVDVRRAFRGQRTGQLLLRQLLVPETKTHPETSLALAGTNQQTLADTHTRVSTGSPCLNSFFFLSDELIITLENSALSNRKSFSSIGRA